MIICKKFTRLQRYIREVPPKILISVAKINAAWVPLLTYVFVSSINSVNADYETRRGSGDYKVESPFIA